MPNWCMNRLSIAADPEVIQKIHAAITPSEPGGKNPQALLQFLRPRPSDQDENWYDWNVSNWGTKWDVDAEIDTLDPDWTFIAVSFDSAWGPPVEALKHWQQQNPGTSLHLDFIETGMGFGGYLDIMPSGFTDEVCYQDEEEYQDYAREAWGMEPEEDDEEPFTEWYLDGVKQLEDTRND